MVDLKSVLTLKSDAILHIRVPASYLKRLKRLADSLNTSSSELVKLVLAEQIDDLERQQKEMSAAKKMAAPIRRRKIGEGRQK